MADAKVIPFDDDRSRSGAGRRRGTLPGAGRDRVPASAGPAPVSALPGGQVPEGAAEAAAWALPGRR